MIKLLGKNRTLLIMLALFPSYGWASQNYSYTFKIDGDNVIIADGAATIINGEENIQPGTPQVGYEVIRLVLPSNTRLDSLLVETNQPVIIAHNLRLDLTKGDIKNDVHPFAQEIHPDTAIYFSNLPYPSYRAQILYSGYWGNIHLADVAVYPLAYRTKSGSLELFDEIRLTFKLSELSIDQISRLKGDPLAYAMLSQSAANCEELLPYAASNGGNYQCPIISSSPLPQYLLITSSDLAAGFEPLVEWKNQKGLPSQIVLIEEVLASSPGIDNAERLRNYLINAHTDGVRWVLLGGDEDIIPLRYLYVGNAIDSVTPPLCEQHIGDIYYSDLTGNWDANGNGVWGETLYDQADIYPELYVGRVLVRNADEAAIWSAKAITYEKDPGAGDPSYLDRALVICADEMRDLGQHLQLERWLSDNFTVDAQRLIEEPLGSSPNPTQPTGEQVIDVMQEGWGFITNLNHGDFSYYAALSSGFNISGRSNVWGDTVQFEHDAGYNHLADLNQPGIHYSASCDVAAFDFDKGIFYPGPYYTTYTLAESYLSQLGGGAAFLGYTRWGWVASSLTLEQKFIRRMLADSTCNLGVAEALSKTDYPTVTDIVYGHNLFGDPQMPFWISVDGALSIHGPAQIDAQHSQTLIFRVFNDDNPAVDAKVCLYKKDEIFMVANTSPQGEVSFDVAPESVGVMTATATRLRYVPAQLKIRVQSASAVSDKDALPEKPSIGQNYPNPFNSSTIITLYLPKDDQVRLEIFDIGGRLVKILSNNLLHAGLNRFIWDGTNENGRGVSSGLYFCRFESGGYTGVRQITMVK
jgi:hypothetical protein